MKRFSVMVQEYGSDHEVEVCQVDGNPETIVKGYQQKMLMVQNGDKRRRTKMSKYTSVRVIDHQAES